MSASEPPVGVDQAGERLSAEERESLSQALRTCRIDDPAPVRLIREGDIHHVAHMVGVAVEAIIADRLASRDARLAAVEALLAPGSGLSRVAKDAIHAALSSDPSERR